ncbi:hypothetical protein CEXT_787681 [Caerostris extrusa]|uniref:Uncharacterized protein n=1 Tax=Caerostris extrusa TaxID=172846 RepID=A0AAV4NTG4_CAEEX|nr:hypothetical protein CEXT_787681 [Caerostris extrusa]
MQHYVHRWSEKQMREYVTPCWVPFTDYLPVFEKGMIAHGNKSHAPICYREPWSTRMEEHGEFLYTYNATIKNPFALVSHFTSQLQHSLQQIRMQHSVHRWSEKQMRKSVTPCWVPFTDYLPVFEKG